MRIVIGSDHAGVFLKEILAHSIRRLGHQILDIGTYGTDPVDYPDYAEAVGKAVIDGKADRGVLVCGSGVGASVAANKMPGIRAGICHDTYSAHQGVEHDDMNVLVLGGRVIGSELASELVTAYLGAVFKHESRHQQRLEKVASIEKCYGQLSHRHKRSHVPVITREHYDAILFDMDGVITDTAGIHASCWKAMFDQFLQRWATQNNVTFRPFDGVADYNLYVDGKPRFLGVRDFLKSRGIVLPEGTSRDASSADTVRGLGNLKNELVNVRLASTGADAYPGTVAFIMYVRRMGIKTAVVTSSENCQRVLMAARIEDLFDVRVDGELLVKERIAGKPAPDSFLKAAEMLQTPVQRAAVIEDAISGIKAGTQGGFGLVIGVDRKNNAEELKAYGADAVVNDLSELLVASSKEVLRPAA